MQGKMNEQTLSEELKKQNLVLSNGDSSCNYMFAIESTEMTKNQIEKLINQDHNDKDDSYVSEFGLVQEEEMKYQITNNDGNWDNLTISQTGSVKSAKLSTKDLLGNITNPDDIRALKKAIHMKCRE